MAENTEENISVAIRIRPLNTKESTNGRVWKVLNKYNSITETDAAGGPLIQRTSGRSFFKFDRVFGEEVLTSQIYNGVVRNIVKSAMEGINGTIFAYGQTSSGKTFTMQGGGPHVLDCPGVIHMAAKDIFERISACNDRSYLVKASFVEIYNEKCFDLLVSGKSVALAVREDTQKGVHVNCNESIIPNYESLLSTLFVGEKNRSVAATEMNDRSSRSHTIFRIMVESRENAIGGDDRGEVDSFCDADSYGASDGAVRISTLNLVDLAGSESVRHTGATGERQKEGGKINQSLLTLSRVIAGLGSNLQHINFRDSKLTRILQPSLSGNARMAIICCATPSQLYLEETRSTLQFASRAKLVKTRATVNEVLDDRAVIKKLQKEMGDLQKCLAMQKNTPYHHLKSNMLKVINLFENSADKMILNRRHSLGTSASLPEAHQAKKRRLSAGCYVQGEHFDFNETMLKVALKEKAQKSFKLDSNIEEIVETRELIDELNNKVALLEKENERLNRENVLTNRKSAETEESLRLHKLRVNSLEMENENLRGMEERNSSIRLERESSCQRKVIEYRERLDGLTQQKNITSMKDAEHKEQIKERLGLTRTELRELRVSYSMVNNEKNPYRDLMMSLTKEKDLRPAASSSERGSADVATLQNVIENSLCDVCCDKENTPLSPKIQGFNCKVKGLAMETTPMTIRN